MIKVKHKCLMCKKRKSAIRMIKSTKLAGEFYCKRCIIKATADRNTKSTNDALPKLG